MSVMVKETVALGLMCQRCQGGWQKLSWYGNIGMQLIFRGSQEFVSYPVMTLYI